MANGRKKSAGKGGKKKGGRRPGRRSWLGPVIVVGILLQTVVAAFVILVLRPAQRPAPPRPPAPVSRNGEPPIHFEEKGGAPAVLLQEGAAKKPVATRPAEPARPQEGRRDKRPLIALVIDDMGYQQKVDGELLQLNLNLSFAFLPYGPLTPHLSARARRLGHDVLLHFPMEPDDPKWDPGPGAVTLAMDRAQLHRIFDADLARVPAAIGINNHMGSRFTQNEDAMRDFLELVREHHLFFLDSMTSSASIGYPLAQEMGVKTARRHVFLDNVREPAAITAQIRQLLKVARRQGWAVGIGHPYPQTLEALRHDRGEILRQVRMVGISQLVH